MTNISFRRLPVRYCFLSILSLCSLNFEVEANDLVSLWAIEDPDGKICLDGGDGGNICEDASSVIRLNYSIHKNIRVAKYEIFKKECKEKFEAGEQPFDSETDALSLSSPSDGDDSITASIEMGIKEGYLSSPWWRRITSTEKEQEFIEFCVVMGLWLPPDQGNMMVNFRETDIGVTFNRTVGTDGEEYVVSSIVLEPKELKRISVEFGGMEGNNMEKNDEDDENNEDDDVDDDEDEEGNLSEEEKDEL